tara:strand:+ start:1764 stop:2531 length:768 start_codon:yes stop_codon:yes gene_type:complete
MEAKLPEWRRFEELRPDQLAELIEHTPIAYWPLGLIEHHGWHLPVGYDGLKADRMCVRMAERTGGVLLPVMWWGGAGGHGDFLWTFYQSEEAAARILSDTTRKLIQFGFRAIVILGGHYPWGSLLEQEIPGIEEEHPEHLMFYGTELSMVKHLGLRGDHAAREETSYGLALFPEFIDMDAMRPGRDDSVWPEAKPVADEGRYPGLSYDPNDPLFAQLGADSRTASAERGEEGIQKLVDCVAESIEKFFAEDEDKS